MDNIKIKLQKDHVYFDSTLPSHSQLLKNVLRSSNGIQRSKFRTDNTWMVICDKRLRQLPFVKKWLSNHLVYFVVAGETLKDFGFFNERIQRILQIAGKKQIAGFISLGGGSVGDFTGFLASVFHRGTPVVHIPSTWLAAMDSAHGGKTALNVGNIKNILGSYHSPQACFIIRKLFLSLAPREIQSAGGELLKTAFITGGQLYSNIKQKPLHPSRLLWQCLPSVIRTKLQIVKKDFLDKTGIRHQLNFGHTIGHVLESYFRLSHGESVLYGMVFAIQWSHHRLGLSSSFVHSALTLIDRHLSWLDITLNKKTVVKTPKDRLQRKQFCILKLAKLLKEIPSSTFQSLLFNDKKRVSGQKINFVFIKKPGHVFAQVVRLSEVLREKKRQSQNELGE